MRPVTRVAQPHPRLRAVAALLVTVLASVFLGVRPATAADTTSGLLVHYDLTQTSGTDVVDSSGAGRDGTLVGSGTWTGVGGLRLDGATSYVALPNDLMRGLSAITVSVQVLVDPDQQTPYFVWGLGNQAGGGYLYVSGDALRAGITRTDWSGEQVTGTTGTLRRGLWTTLTYTQSGTTGTLYQDGAVIATNPAVSIAPADVGGGSTTRNVLGGSDYPQDHLLAGSIKDFRVYGRALSGADVAALRLTDYERITDDRATLTLGDTSSVTADLTLPTTGPWGSSITWATSNADVVTAQGVIRAASRARTAKLTATLTRGTRTRTKVFYVTVAALPTAAQRARVAVDAVVVPGLGDVRGYLTLPTTGPYDASIAWRSSDAGTVATDGVVHRPAAGSPTRTVTLTATARVGAATATRTLTATVPALPAAVDKEGYLFAYFEGDTVSGEKIYFAGSQGNTALAWSTLNGGNPVLTSTMDTTGLRDPYILRSPDGDRFYVLATDLSIGNGTDWGTASSHGSLYLEVWESDDLVHWSAQRHIYVGPADAGDAWAPEATWDPQVGQYVIYWAANTTIDGRTYHRTYTSTTRDFVSVTPAALWVDAGAPVVDTDVLADNGAYYRFSKDDGRTTGCADILQEKNTDLLAVRDDADPTRSTGPTWTVQATCIARGLGLGDPEGPSALKANPGDTSGYGYYLFIDEHAGNGYLPLVTNDLDDPHWTVAPSYQLPPYPRHGTVMPITASELTALQQATHLG